MNIIQKLSLKNLEKSNKNLGFYFKNQSFFENNSKKTNPTFKYLKDHIKIAFKGENKGRVLCGDSKNESYYLFKDQALEKAYIQLQDYIYSPFIILDIDYDYETFYERAERSELLPHIIVANKHKEGLHAVYFIDGGIWHTKRNKKASNFYKNVKQGLTGFFGADENFNGYKSKTPFHTNYLTFTNEENIYLPQACKPYLLEDLAMHLNNNGVFLGQKIKFDLSESLAGQFLGRNCMMFDKLRFIAYKWAGDDENLIYNRLTTIAKDLNKSLSLPLEQSEVNGICKSISKYTATMQARHGKREYFKLYPYISLKEKQRLSALETHQIRKNKSLNAYLKAIRDLGHNASLRSIGRLSKLSHTTVARMKKLAKKGLNDLVLKNLTFSQVLEKIKSGSNGVYQVLAKLSQIKKFTNEQRKILFLETLLFKLLIISEENLNLLQKRKKLIEKSLNFEGILE